jgi:hypothetical protein
MDTTFVQDFLATGRLRLGSFALYAKMDDPSRGDKGEGVQGFMVQDKKVNMGFRIVAGFGHNFWMSSTSAICSKTLMKSFGCNNALAINNPYAFAQAVAGALNTEQPPNILLGPCIYGSNRISVFDSIERFNRTVGLDGNAILQQMQEKTISKKITLSLLHYPDPLFHKSIRDSFQHEFRILWEAKQMITEEYFFVEVPEAIQYCEEASPFVWTD